MGVTSLPAVTHILRIRFQNQGSWTLDLMVSIHERGWRTKRERIFVFRIYLLGMFILIESEESKRGGGKLRI